MTLTALLLGCIAILNMAIGLHVYRKNPMAASHKAFAILAIMLSMWTISLAVTHYSPTANTWALRVAFAAASLIPVAILSFLEHTPSRLPDRWQLRQRVFTPIGLVLSVLSLSPSMVVSVRNDNGASVTHYGALHPVFAIFVITALLYSILVLVRKYRVSTGHARIQVRQLVLAFAAPIAFASFTNLIVPIVFNTSALSKFGPFFTVPMLALIGHSIVRHRLLDMRVVAHRSGIYLAAFCVAGLVLISILSVSNIIFRNEHEIPLPEALLALAVAVLFGPLKRIIHRAFDRYFYREPYNYQRIVLEASEALRGTIVLPSLLGYVTSVVSRTLKPEAVAIYLYDCGDGAFHLFSCLPKREFVQVLPVSLSLVSAVLERRELVFRDDMSTGDSYGMSHVELADVEVEVVVPMIEEDEVIGLLLVGPKLSGDPYFCDDADLLATLANQSAVAIRNAQTHQRVVQLNEELQTVLSTIESGVVAVGGRGEIRLFNRAAERFTGVPAATARGQSVQHLPPPLARCIAGTLADGEPRSQAEFFLPDSAGQLVPLVCSTSPLLSSADQLAGVVAVLNDISHLKQLEHEKRRAERLASIEAIAAGLVHEIRNPLVAVKTFTQLLPTRYHDAEYRESCARTVGREIRRIDNLLTRFRTLASASSESMEMVDVREPMRHALEVLQPQLDERRVHVRQVSDGRPRRIVGNVSQLEQLFLNLCLNALEAMAPEGELTLRVADLSEGGGTTLLVEVSDTGTGIPEDLLAKIFDPFVSSKARGSGLGLAICRAVADAHHARLTARNNEGRPGSTFTVEFPVPLAQATTPAVT